MRGGAKESLHRASVIIGKRNLRRGIRIGRLKRRPSVLLRGRHLGLGCASAMIAIGIMDGMRCRIRVPRGTS